MAEKESKQIREWGLAMKKYLLATASALAIVGSANAADLAVKAAPYRPAPLWAGWYVGLQGGVVSNRGDFSNLSDRQETTSSTKIGGAGGVSFGWLGQQGSFVYGAEADWMWVGAKAQSTFVFPGIPDSTVSVQTFDPNWISTVRGKAGLALDATLVYITGGVAFGHVKNSMVRSNSAFEQTYSENTTRVGWTMGFGVAHQVTSNVVVKAEGRYVDLGKRGVDCTPSANAPLICSTAGATYKGEFSNSLFMGLVGVDFKF
jgi:outer membrane immunogenic protein